MDNQNFYAKTEKIRTTIVKMSDDIRFSFEEALKALESKDAEALAKAPNFLINIKKDAEDAENSIVTSLALYAPEANELRRLIAFLKIANELNKTSEMLTKFSKRMYPFMEEHYYKLPMYTDLIELYKCALVAIKLSNEACKGGENFNYEVCLEKAIAEENRSDELFSLMHKDIILSNYKEEMYVRASIETFNAGRRLERSADIAVSCIALLKYAKTGGKIEEL